jgi:hypothetical protein
VLAVKARGAPVEVQAVGLHTKRLWNKLLKAEDFDGTVKITQAGELAALTGNPTHCHRAQDYWPRASLSASDWPGLDVDATFATMSRNSEPVIFPAKSLMSSIRIFVRHEQTAAHLLFNRVRGCPLGSQGSKM